MKVLVYFLKLVRWPNLLFILLAESLFHFCIYKPLYPESVLTADFPFYFIVATSICIAAAGYIINDYFDVNIDQVNEPQSVVGGAQWFPQVGWQSTVECKSKRELDCKAYRPRRDESRL